MRIQPHRTHKAGDGQAHLLLTRACDLQEGRGVRLRVMTEARCHKPAAITCCPEPAGCSHHLCNNTCTHLSRVDQSNPWEMCRVQTRELKTSTSKSPTAPVCALCGSSHTSSSSHHLSVCVCVCVCLGDAQVLGVFYGLPTPPP